jgi:hypothetical protein
MQSVAAHYISLLLIPSRSSSFLWLISSTIYNHGMEEQELVLVLRRISTEYTSKSVLIKSLSENIDLTLEALLKRGFIEGISLSGDDLDHFRLTEKGRRFVEVVPSRKLSLASR